MKYPKIVIEPDEVRGYTATADIPNEVIIGEGETPVSALGDLLSALKFHKETFN